MCRVQSVLRCEAQQSCDTIKSGNNVSNQQLRTMNAPCSRKGPPAQCRRRVQMISLTRIRRKRSEDAGCMRLALESARKRGRRWLEASQSRLSRSKCHRDIGYAHGDKDKARICQIEHNIHDASFSNDHRHRPQRCMTRLSKHAHTTLIEIRLAAGTN